MKYPLITSLFFSFCLSNVPSAAMEAQGGPLALAQFPSAPATPASLGSLLPEEESVRDFRTKFRLAMNADAPKEMESLVRGRMDDAIKAVVGACVDMAEQPSARIEEEIQALRKTWTATHATDFAERQYKYYSLLKPSQKRARRELQNLHDKTVASYVTGKAEENEGKMTTAVLDLERISEELELLGDNYTASLGWYNTGFYMAELMGEDADQYRLCTAWTRAYETREKAGIKGHLYATAKAAADVLVSKGYGEGESAEGANARGAAGADPDAPALPPILLKPSFVAAEEMLGIQRPHFSHDDIYQTWQTVNLEGVGSTAKILSLADSPTFMRLSAAKVGVDVDGDGESDMEVPMTGNITPVQFSVGVGALKRDIGVLMTIGRTEDTFHGFQQDMGPSDGFMSLFTSPAGSMQMELEGTSLRIFDDNLDGIYGSLGNQVQYWTYAGCRKDSAQPEMDSVLIGNSKHAVPFSELLQVGDVWYSMSVESNGNQISAQPMPGLETGTVKLKIKGLDADYLVLRGMRERENVFIDVLANGNKGVEVPVGSYIICVGQVSKGKRQQTMKAIILPGPSLSNYVVKGGKTLTIELGAPFDFEFSTDQTDGTVRVEESSVVVAGSGGETYQRLWNCVPLVDVNAREAGSKKSIELGTMRPSQSQEDVNVHGWLSAWFPISVEFEKGKLEGETVEVQLTQKKNKLFGKIESSWR